MAENMGTAEILLKMVSIKNNNDEKGFLEFFQSLNEEELNDLLSLSDSLKLACEGQLSLIKMKGDLYESHRNRQASTQATNR